MKKFIEIEKELQEKQNEFKSVKELDEKALQEYRRLPLLDRRENALIKKMTEYEEKQNYLKIYIELLKSNMKAAFLFENAEKIAEVLKKYNGKKCGEKTREKICNELTAATLKPCYLQNDIIRAYIFNNQYTSIGTKYNGKDFPLIISNDNTINAIPADQFKIWYEKTEYIENIPEHIEKINATKAAAAEKQKELETLCNAYNELMRGDMERIYKDKTIQ